MTASKVTIHAEDGYALTAYRHDPVQDMPAHAAVVIAPGMAIRQAFYGGFAALKCWACFGWSTQPKQ